MLSRRCFIRQIGIIGAAGIALGIVGCSATNQSSETEGVALASVPLTQFRTPTCGCCHQYEGYLQGHGMIIDVVEIADTAPVHERFNIPQNMQSCHTSEIAGYFVEGHVPIEVIEKLLSERPKIDGIALPGMPAGSPGMGGQQSGPFIVYAITDGVASIYTEA